jgi:diguanylate cyclase
MAEQKQQAEEYPLFQADTAAQAGEFFRLAVPLLSSHKLPVNPVNFSLVYNYVAGRCPRFKDKLDAYLAQEGVEWSQEEANQFFLRYLYKADESVLDELRAELLAIVAQTIGAMVDLVGKAAISNKSLRTHIEKLAASQKAEDVLSVVSAIMSETRSLVKETQGLEDQLVVSSDEMAKLKEELECAKQEATIDALTGVLNRRGFEVKLASLIKDVEEGRLSFSMIFIDLDHFKKINDSHGHLIGDKVLRAIGGLLTHHTKGGDCSARYGGEEFALLLPETRITSAFNVAENLRINTQKLVLKRPSTGERLDGISASFGVSYYIRGEGREDFLGRTDKALYRAKKLGRNRVVLAD